jgi:hypothetical protein
VHNLSLPMLLIAALKVSVWLAILTVAARQRRLLPLIYAPLGIIATLVRGLSDAHANLPGWAPQAAAFVGTPIAALILASLLVTRPINPTRPGSRWSL